MKFSERARLIASLPTHRVRAVERLAGKLGADDLLHDAPREALRKCLARTVLSSLNVALLDELEPEIRAAMKANEARS